jgi:hypothetical protein
MHRAKAFFFVCTGLFMLLLGYQLCAVRVLAQGGTGIECADTNGNAATVVINRYPWVYVNGMTYRAMQPVPGTAAILACSTGQVVLANGEVWAYNPFNQASDRFTLVTTFPVGPTPSIRKSWGQVKVDHH